MKDRVPLYPGRVKLVPVAGQSGIYDMVRQDAPTQAGDPINKNTLLKDSTAALLGLGADAVPDDVTKALCMQIDDILIASCGGRCIKVKVLSANGVPAPGIIVSGITPISGDAAITNEVGIAIGSASGDTVTINVTGYIDIAATAKTVSTPYGKITNAEIILKNTEFIKISSSTTVKFSPLIEKLDITVVGGGGGGAGGLSSGGGGGGGGYCVVRTSVSYSPNTVYTATIGAGGPHVSGDTFSNGLAGGATSILGITAGGGAGGLNGRNESGAGGTGNGNGGNRGSGAGTAGTVSGYSSISASVVYGGGGGGGAAGKSSVVQGGSGAGYGGNGGAAGPTSSQDGTAGTDGYGGGGGAGGGTNYSETSGSRGRQGGSGCITMRMKH